MDLRLTNRTFIVSGGSSGLGLASARELVGEGANVVLSGRSQGSLGEAVKALGARSIGVVADLSDPESAARLVNEAEARFGGLDGALISMGGPPLGTVMEITDDAWREAVEMILIGAVRLARVTAQALCIAGSEGSIAFVISASAKSPHHGLATSNGLRPGIAMLGKELADELGPYGIRVNSLIPGRIRTPRLEKYDEFIGEEKSRERRAEIPLGRYGEPEEFGRVAAFVLSPAASYINGSIVTVDGGALRAL